MSPRIENLKKLIEKSEGCRATHFASSVVRERFEDAKKPVWEGVVETFELENHPNGVKRAYAWQGWVDENQREPEYKVILGIPPVNSPERAVKVAVAAEILHLLRKSQEIVDSKNK